VPTCPSYSPLGVRRTAPSETQNRLIECELDPERPSPFRLERTSQRCLLVSGELDLMTASQLHLALGDERIEVVDLSGVTFIDVAGLRPLLSARCGGDRPVHVRHPSSCVRRLLELLDVRNLTCAPEGQACDPARPLDQFVDEILERMTALHDLLGAEGPAVDRAAVRRAGHHVVAALRSQQAPKAAAQLVAALWSTSSGGLVPDDWLSTPLGTLVERTARVQRRSPPSS